MRWSWKIGRLAGIDVYLHVTFLLLLPIFASAFYSPANPLVSVLRGLAYLALLFGIVVMHELGHALAARRYGIQTRDITLLPIGGVARLERIPREPLQELIVALAGPAVNVVLAAALAIILRTAGTELQFSERISQAGMLHNLFWVNVILAGFNLLPAFPMDGGRVLRALLALRMDYVPATRIAAGVGQGMALLFGMLGLLGGNPMLMVLALFVFMGAGQEAALVSMQSALGGVPVRQAMITDFRSLQPADPLSRAIDYTLAGYQQEFPVLTDQQLVGILTRRDLLAALAQRGANAPVGDVMRKQFVVGDMFEMLDRAWDRLRESGGDSLPILHEGRLVGLLTRENLGEFLMLSAALRGQRPVPLAE